VVWSGNEYFDALDVFSCAFPDNMSAAEYAWTYVNIALGTFCLLLLVLLSFPATSHPCSAALHKWAAKLDFKMAFQTLRRVDPEELAQSGLLAEAEKKTLGVGHTMAPVNVYGSATAAQETVRLRAVGNSGAHTECDGATSHGDTSTASAESGAGSGSGDANHEEAGNKARLMQHRLAAFKIDDGDGHHAMMRVAQRGRGSFGGFLTVCLLSAFLSNAMYLVVKARSPTQQPVVQSFASGALASAMPVKVYFGFDCSGDHDLNCRYVMRVRIHVPSDMASTRLVSCACSFVCVVWVFAARSLWHEHWGVRSLCILTARHRTACRTVGAWKPSYQVEPRALSLWTIANSQRTNFVRQPRHCRACCFGWALWRLLTWMCVVEQLHKTRARGCLRSILYKFVVMRSPR